MRPPLSAVRALEHRALPDRVAELSAEIHQRRLAFLLDSPQVGLDHDHPSLALQAAHVFPGEEAVLRVRIRYRPVSGSRCARRLIPTPFRRFPFLLGCSQVVGTTGTPRRDPQVRCPCSSDDLRRFACVSTDAGQATSPRRGTSSSARTTARSKATQWTPGWPRRPELPTLPRFDGAIRAGSARPLNSPGTSATWRDTSPNAGDAFLLQFE